jgi:hypothetical protein
VRHLVAQDGLTPGIQVTCGGVPADRLDRKGARVSPGSRRGRFEPVRAPLERGPHCVSYSPILQRWEIFWRAEADKIRVRMEVTGLDVPLSALGVVAQLEEMAYSFASVSSLFMVASSSLRCSARHFSVPEDSCSYSRWAFQIRKLLDQVGQGDGDPEPNSAADGPREGGAKAAAYDGVNGICALRQREDEGHAVQETEQQDS